MSESGSEQSKVDKKRSVVDVHAGHLSLLTVF
jgi:hypothetical protein